MTKSPPSKPARWANDQVPAEEACEAGRTTKFTPRELARKEPRPTLLAHDGRDRTYHHKNLSGPCMQYQGGPRQQISTATTHVP